MSKKDKLDISKMRENPEIFSNITFVNDPTSVGKLRVVTKLPSLPKDGLAKNNFNSVVSEMDRKMKKITEADRKALQEYIEKGVKNGFIVKLEDLSPETQASIQDSPNLQYVSVAPAFKSSSLSTPARITYNLSRQDRNTQ